LALTPNSTTEFALTLKARPNPFNLRVTLAMESPVHGAATKLVLAE